jgi:rubrerythrin
MSLTPLKLERKLSLWSEAAEWSQQPRSVLASITLDEEVVDYETSVVRTAMAFIREPILTTQAAVDEEFVEMDRAMLVQSQRAAARLKGLNHLRDLSSNLHALLPSSTQPTKAQPRDSPMALSERLLGHIARVLSTPCRRESGVGGERTGLHILTGIDTAGTITKDSIHNAFYAFLTQYFALTGHRDSLSAPPAATPTTEVATPSSSSVWLSPTARLHLMSLCAIDFDYGTIPDSVLASPLPSSSWSRYRSLSRARDLAALGKSGVVSFLQPLSSISTNQWSLTTINEPFAPVWLLRHAGWSLFRLLSYTAASISPPSNADVEPEQEGAYRLQLALLLFMRHQLEDNLRLLALDTIQPEAFGRRVAQNVAEALSWSHAACALQSAERAARLEADPNARSPAQLQFAYLLSNEQILWVLLRCCLTPSTRQTLATDTTWIKLLLQVLHGNWPLAYTSQMIALRICRHLLPLMSPSDAVFTTVVSSSSSDGDTKTNFVQQLLDRIGSSRLASSLPDGVAASSAAATPKPALPVPLKLGDECVSLLRELMNTESWRVVINKEINTSLSNWRDTFRTVPHLVDFKDTKITSLLTRGIGSLWVLGGGCAFLREASRVLIEYQGRAVVGSVLRLFQDRKTSEKKAQVWIDGDIGHDAGGDVKVDDAMAVAGEKLQVRRDALVPIDDVAVPLMAINEPEEIIRTLAALIFATETAAATRKRTSDEKSPTPSSSSSISPLLAMSSEDARAELVRAEIKQMCVKSLTVLLDRPDMASLMLEHKLGPSLVPLASQPVMEDIKIDIDEETDEFAERNLTDAQREERNETERSRRMRTIAELETRAILVAQMVRDVNAVKKKSSDQSSKSLSEAKIPAALSTTATTATTAPVVTSTVPPTQWECPVCTLLNSRRDRRCIACETAQPVIVPPVIVPVIVKKAESKALIGPTIVPLEQQLALLGYDIEMCRRAVEATKDSPVEEVATRAIQWLLSQGDHVLVPGVPLSLFPTYGVTLPPANVNPVDIHFAAYAFPMDDTSMMTAKFRSPAPESKEFKSMVESQTLVGLYAVAARNQDHLSSLYARRCLLSLLHQHRSLLEKEADETDKPVNGPPSTLGNDDGEDLPPLPSALTGSGGASVGLTSSGGGAGLVLQARSLSLHRSSVKHALASFGPAGFLAKFVALVCASPAQLEVTSLQSNGAPLRLVALREVVLSVLSAERTRVARAAEKNSSLTNEELKRLAPIAGHMATDLVLHLLSFTNGSRIDTKVVLSTVIWTCDVFFALDNTNTITNGTLTSVDSRKPPNRLLEFLFIPQILLALTHSIAATTSDTQLTLIRLLGRMIRQQLRLTSATSSNHIWYSAVLPKFNVITGAMHRVLLAEGKVNMGLEAGLSYPHSHLCKALIDVALSVKQWHERMRRLAAETGATLPQWYITEEAEAKAATERRAGEELVRAMKAAEERRLKEEADKKKREEDEKKRIEDAAKKAAEELAKKQADEKKKADDAAAAAAAARRATGTSTLWNCNQCGVNNPMAQRFCSECGTRQPEALSTPVVVPTPTPTTPTPTPPVVVSTPPSSRPIPTTVSILSFESIIIVSLSVLMWC